MITIYRSNITKSFATRTVRLFDDLGYDDILWIDLLSPDRSKSRKPWRTFWRSTYRRVSRSRRSRVRPNIAKPRMRSSAIRTFSFRIPRRSVSSPFRSSLPKACSSRCAPANSGRLPKARRRLQMNYRAYSTGYHLLISILEVRIDFDADLVEALAKEHRHAEQKHEPQRTVSTRKPSSRSATCRRIRC